MRSGRLEPLNRQSKLIMGSKSPNLGDLGGLWASRDITKYFASGIRIEGLGGQCRIEQFPCKRCVYTVTSPQGEGAGGVRAILAYVSAIRFGGGLSGRCKISVGRILNFVNL